MLLAEAVSISGDVVLLVLLVLLIVLLTGVSVVVGTAIAARRHARTGSTASAVVAAVGASLELLVFVAAAVQAEPITMAISGGALLVAGVAYATANRAHPTP
ncbi:hypothetical protein NHL50_16220 [Acidimicrobiia bacterium EGI L10123]|uniref:hypothetical protein n=1 Tax=Salinilacustrithrix flava TaxID=2957203 RepID=UPI003D7C1DC4|nr:hypothetical protein [Acidimicrobiia bacterium EGI L10123]